MRNQTLVRVEAAVLVAARAWINDRDLDTMDVRPSNRPRRYLLFPARLHRRLTERFLPERSFNRFLTRKMPMDSAMCFDLFIWKYGLSRNIRLEKTSEQPELADYYNYIGSLGSTFMDIDGSVCITIHDLGGATPSTWYEWH